MSSGGMMSSPFTLFREQDVRDRSSDDLVQALGNMLLDATYSYELLKRDVERISRDMGDVTALPSIVSQLEGGDGGGFSGLHSDLTLDDGTNPHGTTKSNVGLGNVSNDAQLKIASNLSDLNSASTARSSLGLGTVATRDAETIGELLGGTYNGVSVSINSWRGLGIGFNTSISTGTVQYPDVAIGDDAQASGISITTNERAAGIAIGTVVSGLAGGIAIGSYVSASGGITIGQESTSGTDGIVIGDGSTSGFGGITVGSYYSGEFGITIGTESRCGDNGIAIGRSAKADAAGSIAIGYSAETSLDFDIVIRNNVTNSKCNIVSDLHEDGVRVVTSEGLTGAGTTASGTVEVNINGNTYKLLYEA